MTDGRSSGGTIEELAEVVAENARLRQRVEELEQACSDLDIALSTAVEHGDMIESSLYAANAKLRTEVRDRVIAERRLARVLLAVRQQKTDLELLVETITEHSDEIDTEWLQRFAVAESLSRTDSLTGLANRREINDHMDREWRRCARSGQNLALIMIDVDYFKGYNDAYGHAAGDAALCRVAEILKAACRRTGDLAGRMGGEEFLVVLPETDRNGAEVQARRLRQGVWDANVVYDEGQDGRMTISVGVAVGRPDATGDWAELLALADNLLYIAKRDGRNAIKTMDDLPAPVGGDGAGGSSS